MVTSNAKQVRLHMRRRGPETQYRIWIYSNGCTKHNIKINYIDTLHNTTTIASVGYVETDINRLIT